MGLGALNPWGSRPSMAGEFTRKAVVVAFVIWVRCV